MDIQILATGIGILINALTWLYVTKRYMPNLMQDVLNGVGADLAENIKKIMLDPTMKKGFSLAGTLGGQTKTLNAAENNMSLAIINKQIGTYKPLIQQFLGIDVDGAIEDYGAPAVLQLIQKFLPIIQNAMGGKSNKGTGALP